MAAVGKGSHLSVQNLSHIVVQCGFS